MNALQAAEYLEKDFGYKSTDECAALLRRQHEAIVKLRKAAADALYVLEAWERDCDHTLYGRDRHEAMKDVKQALADTEEI